MGPENPAYKTFSVPDWVFALKLNPVSFRGGSGFPRSSGKDLERRRLFSIATRHYLRRRAWRYFRKLGRAHPERYVAAVREALIQYRDDDVADGLALIDNWGLIHILFHFSPCLVADDRGWKVAEGHSLAELEPAPAYAKLWDAAPRALVDLLIRGAVPAGPGLGDPDDPPQPGGGRAGLLAGGAARPAGRATTRRSSGLAADLLRDDPALTEVATERWLSLVETASPPRSRSSAN